MNQAPVAVALPSSVKVPEAGSLTGLAAIFLILLLITICVTQASPPAVVSADAPLSEFSAVRALADLKEVASAPHPIGSMEQARVRDYLLRRLSALGVQPEVQQAVAVSSRGRPPYRAATVNNIVARLRGAGDGKAVGLIAHYDSVPTSPGASDNGSGVVVLLETLQALKAGPPLTNDVIFLFTDAEEVGLLGAEAFVAEHPWARDIGLVLNFDARGTSGPSVMFETSGNNRQLIKGLANTRARPFASSLFNDLYRLLPNDTDMSVLKRAGLPGLNFAFTKGAVRYNTGEDNMSALDMQSLQHQGSNALALTRHFGNENLSARGRDNAIYFNLPGGFLVRYRQSWTVPLLLVTIICFAALVVYGFKKRLLTLRGLVLGFVALPVGMICAVVAVGLIWNVVRMLHGGYKSLLLGDTYNSGLYMASFTALSAAISCALYFRLRRKRTPEDLWVGALAFWALLAASTTVLLPGGSYLFTLPLLFSVPALILLFYLKTRKEGLEHSWKGASLFAVSLAPSIGILVPAIYLLFLTLMLNMSFVGAALVVLACSLLFPLYSLVAPDNRWKFTGGIALLSVALLAAGGLTASFDRDHPRQNNLIYALNADTANAAWASADAQLDEWTSQFIKRPYVTGALAEFFPQSSVRFMQSPAQLEQLESPRIELLSDETSGNARTVRLHVHSPRQAQIITIGAAPGVTISESWVAGRRVENAQNRPGERPWSLRYYGLPQEGFDLVLKTMPGSLSLRAIDQSYGLPGTAKTRPENFTTSIHLFSDSTFVSKSFNF